MTDSEEQLTGSSLVLPPGVSEHQVVRAVNQSGYPLQSVVSHKLRQLNNLGLQPEWGYRDRTTGEMRALDLLAVVDFSGEDLNRFRVRPAAALLIECKKAELPYIFFAEDQAPYGQFPHVAGLKSESITFKTDDDRSTWSLPILEALDLRHHAFVREPAACSTFSRCERKGKDIILSGSDPYQSVVLPLRSATDYYRKSLVPIHTPYYFDAHIVLAVCVIDAPMLAATIASDGSHLLKNVQWQRLWRNEPEPDSFKAQFGQTSAIDIVHVDFLDEYLTGHVLPFAEEFAQRSHEHAEELATGLAFASGMGEDSFSNLATRMEPRKLSVRMPEVVETSTGKALLSLGRSVFVTELANMKRRRKRRRRRAPYN